MACTETVLRCHEISASAAPINFLVAWWSPRSLEAQGHRFPNKNLKTLGALYLDATLACGFGVPPESPSVGNRMPML